MRNLAPLLLLFALVAEASAGTREEKLAEEVAQEAIALYRAGNHTEAARLFVEAYELSKHPTQLRNAAKAYEAADRLDDARALWERYAAHAGVGRDERAEALANIGMIDERRRANAAKEEAEQARLRAEAAHRAAEAARADAERAKTRPPTVVVASPADPTLGFVGIGSGAALAIASGVVWLLQSQRLSDLDARLGTRDQNGKIIDITPAEVEAELNAINGQRLAAGVLLGVGAAAALGGVAWLVFAPDELPSEVALEVGPGGARFAWRATW